MATAVITLTNIKQKVSANGKRVVEATLDFNVNAVHVSGGLNLSTI